MKRIRDSTAFVRAQHGPLHESRPEESSTTFCGGAGPRRGQRGQPLPPERVAERLARIDALLAQVSLDEEEEEVMEEEIPEVQVSRCQGVFRPRRLCPNLLRGSRCHCGNRCTFAHAFHELADEGWYVPGSTADWCSVQVLLVSKVVLFSVVVLLRRIRGVFVCRSGKVVVVLGGSDSALLFEFPQSSFFFLDKDVVVPVVQRHVMAQTV